MNSQPKVSVIVPIYGVEAYLRQCIDSILSQTLQEIEILLINDGSPDLCGAIIDDYEKKDPRIKCIHKQNGGYGQTCNRGLSLAKGEYISIIEPDDYIDPTMFFCLYTKAKQNDVDIIKSSFNHLYTIKNEPELIVKNEWFRNNKPKGIFTLKEHPEFLSFHPSIWSALYKNSFLQKNNIQFEEVPGAGWTDNLFQVQTFALAESISYIDQSFYFWRCTEWDESKSLKDYKIPFLRSKSIHKWLRTHKIDNPNVLAHLYKREINYLQILIPTLKYKNLNEAEQLTKDYLSDMEENIILSHPALSRKDKNRYYFYKNGIRNAYYSLKMKAILKFLFSFKIKKDGGYILLLGLAMNWGKIKKPTQSIICHYLK